MASIAATGFGLSGLCIGESRGYGKAAAIRDRVRQTLRFLKMRLPNEHGFFYHFIDIETGERVWNCELSSIDTSLLLCGVLTVRQHFNDAEIQDLATAIYERVDWPWMLNGLRTIRECYPKAWGRYGFVDAFNPLTGWYNPDVLGIDLGITMLMGKCALGIRLGRFHEESRMRGGRWRKLDSKLLECIRSSSSQSSVLSRWEEIALLFRLLLVY